LTKSTQHIRLHLNISKNSSNYLTSIECLCSHTKSYSAKNCCHQACRCDNFFCVLKNVLVILSVLTTNLGLNRYNLHMPRQCTIAIVSFSWIEYFCSTSFNFQLSKAIGYTSCTSSPPIALSEALVCILNGFSKSGSPKTKADATTVFSFSQGYWLSTDHSHL